MEALGALHCTGVAIAWQHVYPGAKTLAGLPTYPFDHSQSYWYSPPATQPPASDPLHYRISWEPVHLSAEQQAKDSFWWLIPGDLALANALALQLKANGAEVLVADSDAKPEAVDLPLSIVWLENCRWRAKPCSLSRTGTRFRQRRRSRYAPESGNPLRAASSRQ